VKIFISYAREDARRLVDVQQALEIHEVWVDHRLTVGKAWWEEIERQIAGADCFVLLLSPHSVASEYCQKELEVAARLGKPVAPVMLEAMAIPDHLAKYQVIHLADGDAPAVMVKLLNGLFEIERQVFNPLKSSRTSTGNGLERLAISDLCFVTTSRVKKRIYEQILNVELTTNPIHIEDVAQVDAGVVALHKAVEAYEILKKPVYVEHAALSVRAWGGFPGGLVTAFMHPVGLQNICKMLHPFADKYAECIAVIAFTDGTIRRKFTGVLPGTIADAPRGNGWSFNNIFIPAGFSLTLGEMSEEEHLSVGPRRRAILDFMRFLQENYEIV
jgi:XTP/dITP diphosphohydrolase